MEKASLTLMHHYGDKGDHDKLNQTLEELLGAKNFSINWDSHILDMTLSKDLTVQHVINEINNKTGFKAF